jgi:hypothetical protein
MKEEIHEYDKELEIRWKNGELQEEWFEKYPEVFRDSRDYVTLKAQPSYHFGESFMAI